MFFEQELNIKILSPEEKLLGFLHPNYVEIVEENELNGLRSLEITHPLIDDNNRPLTHYNNLLSIGNKIWREHTGDGNSCLYVLLEDKEVDPKENTVSIKAEEIATELSMLPPIRLIMPKSVIITKKWLEKYFGSQFRIGTVNIKKKFIYNGTIGRMSLLRKIETETQCEFNFKYKYNLHTNTIQRYLDFQKKRGKKILEPIKIGYNTENIQIEENEADVAIAAAPLGAPQNTKKKDIAAFHKLMKAFEDLHVKIGQKIPRYITKNKQGKLVNGPSQPAPYPKIKGQTYVQSPPKSSGANYKSVRFKEKSPKSLPRTILFESHEEHPSMFYWECVQKIREKHHTQFKITTNIIDIQKLTKCIPTFFNVGDIVPIKLPGRCDQVMARVIKTVKNPREFEKDKIELGNYNINFFADYIHHSYPHAKPYITLTAPTPETIPEPTTEPTTAPTPTTETTERAFLNPILKYTIKILTISIKYVVKILKYIIKTLPSAIEYLIKISGYIIKTLPSAIEYLIKISKALREYFIELLNSSLNMISMIMEPPEGPFTLFNLFKEILKEVVAADVLSTILWLIVVREIREWLKDVIINGFNRMKTIIFHILGDLTRIIAQNIIHTIRATGAQIMNRFKEILIIGSILSILIVIYQSKIIQVLLKTQTEYWNPETPTTEPTTEPAKKVVSDSQTQEPTSSRTTTEPVCGNKSGTIGWNDPQNVQKGKTYATYAKGPLNSTENTKFLEVSGFKFNIPTTAKITKISIAIEARKEGKTKTNLLSTYLTDADCQTTNFPLNPKYATYTFHFPKTKWEGKITPKNINSKTLKIWCTIGFSQTIYIRKVWLTLKYEY